MPYRRLEEMVKYCTNLTECRRQTFYETFGTSEVLVSSSTPNTTSSSSSRIQKSTSRNFQRCGTMCDNCLARGQEYTRESIPPRHVFHPKSKGNTNSLPNSEWIESRSATRTSTSTRTGKNISSFTTASGKKIQPSIISLENEENEEQEEAEEGEEEEFVSTKRKRKSDSLAEETRQGWITPSRASSSSSGSSSMSKRGQKLFQSAKDALIQTASLFISNQTPRRVQSHTLRDDEVEFIE